MSNIEELHGGILRRRDEKALVDRLEEETEVELRNQRLQRRREEKVMAYQMQEETEDEITDRVIKRRNEKAKAVKLHEEVEDEITDRVIRRRNEKKAKADQLQEEATRRTVAHLLQAWENQTPEGGPFPTMRTVYPQQEEHRVMFQWLSDHESQEWFMLLNPYMKRLVKLCPSIAVPAIAFAPDYQPIYITLEFENDVVSPPMSDSVTAGFDSKTYTLMWTMPWLVLPMLLLLYDVPKVIPFALGGFTLLRCFKEMMKK